MSKRLSVSNLHHQMTEEKLHILFSEAGYVVLTKIIPYLHNGLPAHFGFVEMKTRAEGQKAVSLLNGRNVEGRLMVVREDRPQSKCTHGRRSGNCR